MINADDGSRSRLPLRIAAALYGVGMLILLSPVSSDLPLAGMQVPRVGEVVNDGSRLCGLTLTAAFVTPTGSDDEGERKADCAAKASDRVGYGLLALALAAPLAVGGAVRRR